MAQCRRPRLACNLSVGFSPTQTSLRSELQTMITRSNSLSRGSGMPIQVDGVLVHAMSGTELSRVRTELHQLCILPAVSPHPVQPNREPSGHGDLSDVPLPAHRQVRIPSSPVRITSRRGLCCFSQQETQQRTALLADVPQPLMAGTGVFRRNQSDIAADLLAALKSFRSSDDQHEGQCRQWTYARVCHEALHFGLLLRLLLDGPA